MRILMIFLLLSVAVVAVAGMQREEIHGGVKITFQTDAVTNPTGIVNVATAFVDALNRQDAKRALEFVHKGQQDTWKTYLAKTQEKHDLSLAGIVVFVGDYKIEGKRLRDQQMARVKTEAKGGNGGMSFLMLMNADKWVVVID